MHLKRRMRFCFIVEEQYRGERMPMVVAHQLRRSGHGVDVLEPSTAVTCLSDLARQSYDAYVLKTVSDGPGLCLLEAAEAAGIPTINNSRAIRFVRDKTILSALACAKGLPIPRTYFVVDPRLLKDIPEKDYPLVLKPTNGSSGRGIYLINSPADLPALKIACPAPCFFLAQQYVDNAGYDIKLYVIGEGVYAVARKSPLHPEMNVTSQLIPVQLEWLKLAKRVGEIFGLDIYGLDVVATSNGPVVVDINDFPSFGRVPRAVNHLSAYILRIAEHARFRRRDKIAFGATTQSSARAATLDAAARPFGINPELHDFALSRSHAVGLSARHKSGRS
jgi:ribosomal protein S6--L-glutamate ligase